MKRILDTRAERFRTWLLPIAILLLLPGASHGGVMFFAGRLDGDRFVPDENVQGAAFRVRYSSINVAIDGRRATTAVEETIEGRAPDAEHVLCVIPLPEGAEPAGKIGWRKGDGSLFPAVTDEPAGGRGRKKTPVPFSPPRYLGPDEAQKLYEALAVGTDNVGILALSGKPALVSDQFPAAWLDGQVAVTYEYAQPVGQRDGVWDFRWLD